MKALFIGMSLAAAAGLLHAGESVSAVFGHTPIWNEKNFSFQKHLKLANEKNHYCFSVVQTKPAGRKAPETIFFLQEPRDSGGFARPLYGSFLRFQINEIPTGKIQPKEEDFLLWKKEDRAGCDVTFNFNGAKVILSVFMTKDSPLLFFRLFPSEKTLEKVQNMSLTLQAIPSMHKMEKGKGTLWSGVYQREALTAVRTIRQQKGRILLDNKDRYLVFLDRELDGSAKEKGTGPCLAAFKADKSTVIEAEIQNSWVNQLIFHSKKDFRCLEFALWSTETSCSNAEFESAIKKTPADFVIP